VYCGTSSQKITNIFVSLFLKGPLRNYSLTLYLPVHLTVFSISYSLILCRMYSDDMLEKLMGFSLSHSVVFVTTSLYMYRLFGFFLLLVCSLLLFYYVIAAYCVIMKE